MQKLPARFEETFSWICFVCFPEVKFSDSEIRNIDSSIINMSNRKKNIDNSIADIDNSIKNLNALLPVYIFGNNRGMESMGNLYCF